MTKLKKRRLQIDPVMPDDSVSKEKQEEINNLKESLNIEEESGAEPEVLRSETIDLNDKTKSENIVTVDYTSPNFLEDFVSTKTNDSQEETETEKGKNEFSGKSTDQIKSEIHSAEQNSDSMSAEDFYSVADIIITILDTFLANMMKIYAKDSKESEYSLTDKKKKHLVKMLASILIKYQTRFKTEFLFIFALILFYAAPFMAARSRRKKIVALEKEFQARKEAEAANGFFTPEQNSPIHEQIRKEEIVEEANVIHEEAEEEFMENIPVSLKKSRGVGKKK